jgi:hypothetical protein
VAGVALESLRASLEAQVWAVLVLPMVIPPDALYAVTFVDDGFDGLVDAEARSTFSIREDKYSGRFEENTSKSFE